MCNLKFFTVDYYLTIIFTLFTCSVLNFFSIISMCRYGKFNRFLPNRDSHCLYNIFMPFSFTCEYNCYVFDIFIWCCAPILCNSYFLNFSCVYELYIWLTSCYNFILSTCRGKTRYCNFSYCVLCKGIIIIIVLR